MAKRWYIVHTLTDKEYKAKLDLETRIKNAGKEEEFGEILIPEHTEIKVIRGKKKTRQKRFYPGYIFVEMEMSEENWHLVKSAKYVTGFVGHKKEPDPVPEEEMKRILARMKKISGDTTLDFVEGDTVKIIDGPFATFSGVITEIHPNKERLKVLITIFGRPTPVELSFTQVEKIS